MVHFVQSIIWCSFICHSLCNLRKFRSTVRLHIVCNISFPLKESTMGREKGWSSGNRSKDRRRLDPIGPERFWRLCLILVWDWPLVGLETLEKKNLLASKRSSLLLPFTPALAGPFSWGLNIRTLLAPVSNSSRLIGRPALSPEEEWARPFGMGRTDKPLLAVSIASKLLLQHDDSAIPCTMGAPPTILGIIQFGRLSLSCQQIPSSSDNPPGRNYSYLKTQQVVAVTIFSFFLYEMVYFKVPGEYSTKFLSHSVYDRPEEGDAPSPWRHTFTNTFKDVSPLTLQLISKVDPLKIK